MTNNLNSLDQPKLVVHQYQIHFQMDEPAKLPRYAGSTWRGAFGHALKKTVCVVRNTKCAECMLRNSCAYSYVFETPPPENGGKMRKYSNIQHPFILQIPQHQSTTSYQLNLNLFGKGQHYFPYIVYALKKAGEDGIGKQRQPFQLKRINKTVSGKNITVYEEETLTTDQSNTCITPPPLPEIIHIDFITPVRIKQNGHNLSQTTFNFSAFFSSLLRRISMLTYFHSDTPLETDFACLTQQAKEIDFSEQTLCWYDWSRYSNRQRTEMQMGGVIGQVTLNMAGLEPLWPYIWLGQYTHVGKATSMGLGQYSVQTTSLSKE